MNRIEVEVTIKLYVITGHALIHVSDLIIVTTNGKNLDWFVCYFN